MQGRLDFNRTIGCFDGALKFHEKCITGRFYLTSIMFWKERSEYLSMFIEQLESKSLIFLSKRTITNQISKHNSRKSSHNCGWLVSNSVAISNILQLQCLIAVTKNL